MNSAIPLSRAHICIDCDSIISGHKCPVCATEATLSLWGVLRPMQETAARPAVVPARPKGILRDLRKRLRVWWWEWFPQKPRNVFVPTERRGRLPRREGPALDPAWIAAHERRHGGRRYYEPKGARRIFPEVVR